MISNHTSIWTCQIPQFYCFNFNLLDSGHFKEIVLKVPHSQSRRTESLSVNHNACIDAIIILNEIDSIVRYVGLDRLILSFLADLSHFTAEVVTRIMPGKVTFDSTQIVWQCIFKWSVF